MILAERTQMSSDGLECKIVLRTNSYFWDGSHVTSTDVRSSFERFRRSGHVHRWVLDSLKGISDFDATNSPHVSGITLVSEREIRIEFGSPEPDFPWLISSLATAITKDASDQGLQKPYGTQTIGAGPFRFSGNEAGSTFTFERNMGFPLTNEFGRLELAIIENPQNQLDQIRSGKLQALRLRGPMLSEACNTKGTSILPRPEFGGYRVSRYKTDELLFLYFNWNSPRFAGIPEPARKTWLQKLGEQLDRRGAAVQLYQQTASVADTIFSNATNESGGYEAKLESPVSASLISPNDPSSRALASYIEGHLKGSRVEFTPEFLDPATLVQRALKRDFDVAIFWIELQIPSRDQLGWLGFFNDKSPMVGFGQSLPGIGDRIARARRTTNLGERSASISQITADVSRIETAWLPLLRRDAVFLLAPSIREDFVDRNGTPVIGLVGCP
jgi:ABC-type oligopeptide transport system substrate-binding subunit